MTSFTNPWISDSVAQRNVLLEPRSAQIREIWSKVRRFFKGKNVRSSNAASSCSKFSVASLEEPDFDPRGGIPCKKLRVRSIVPLL
mmetsp:Transcript_521/g.742  ORF Transcript_521/g.742 Transcript_521/m.742 type:complete len:86 (-) Transcript_521:786-1043(-)